MNKPTKLILIVEVQILFILIILLVIKTSKIEKSLSISTALISEIFKDKQHEILGVTSDMDITIGDPNADINIIMYTKFDCIHCNDFFDETFPQLYNEFIQTGYVNFTIRYLFGVQHEHVAFAQLAYEAYHHNRYMEFHDIINSDNHELSKEKMQFIEDSLNIAPEGNLDIIKNNFREVLKAGITGTPTFFINGKKYSGHRRIKFFRQIIEFQNSTCD